MANTHASFHRNTVVGGRGGGGRNGPGICLVPSFGVQVLDSFNPGNYILSAGVSNVCNERAYNVTVEVVITMDCNGATVPVTDFVAPTYPYSVGANSFAQLYNAERVSGCSSDFYAPSFTEYYAGYYSATLADGTSDYASASTSRTYSNFRSHWPNGIATSSKKPKPYFGVLYYKKNKT